MIDFSTFEGLDLRVGTILSADDFIGARDPSYQLRIDFVPLRILHSSAEITKRYSKEALQGKQIIAVVNIGVKKIAHYESQCLVLGAKEADDVILLAPDSPLANGQQIL